MPPGHLPLTTPARRSERPVAPSSICACTIRTVRAAVLAHSRQASSLESHLPLRMSLAAQLSSGAPVLQLKRSLFVQGPLPASKGASLRLPTSGRKAVTQRASTSAYSRTPVPPRTITAAANPRLPVPLDPYALERAGGASGGGPSQAAAASHRACPSVAGIWNFQFYL